MGLFSVAVSLGLLPATAGAALLERPAPENTSAPATTIAQAVPAFISPPTLNILPVPDVDIPVGNIDGMPTISIPRDATQSRGMASPGLNRAATLGLNYRVVVNAPDERSQEAVRSLVPDAFRTWINGQSVMQVGAYAALENAQDIIQLLNQYGIQAVVQPIQ